MLCPSCGSSSGRWSNPARQCRTDDTLRYMRKATQGKGQDCVPRTATGLVRHASAVVPVTCGLSTGAVCTTSSLLGLWATTCPCWSTKIT